MKIETERLELVALMPYQLKLWVEDVSALEKELDVVYKAEPMKDIFLDIVKGQLAVTEKNIETLRFYTISTRRVSLVEIMSIIFKCSPLLYIKVKI